MSETTKYNFWARTGSLLVGDVVDTSDPMAPKQPWCTAIVKKVDDEFVTFYRPYGHHADFTYGSEGQVICYTGLEEYKVERRLDRQWTVFQRDLSLHQPAPPPVTPQEITSLKNMVRSARTFFDAEIGGDDMDFDERHALEAISKLENS